MTFVFDFDNHDGELTTQDIKDCKQAGMQGAIVGLQYPGNPYPRGVAHQQIEALLEARVPLVACYAESQHISETWERVKQFRAHIPQVYQAAEEPHVDRQWIDSSLDFIDALGLAVPRGGIYTGPWWWNVQPDNVKHWFGDRDCWIAAYDGNPDPDIAPPMGDWTHYRIKQWNGHAQVGRLLLDLNTDRTWSA
jgi:hypothetical protein